MPAPDPRQLDFDAAVREVVARADRPSDVNRLVAAAVRLRGASLALHDANPAPEQPCDFAAWCDSTCPDDFEPDVRGTRRDILHIRRWPLSGGPLERVTLGQLEIPQEAPRRPGDDDLVVWLDHEDARMHDAVELSVDQADQLAGALAAAVRAARGADQ